MKKLIYTLIYSFLLINSACSQEKTNELEGEWKYLGNKECPDFIYLHSNGRYIVFNDCEGNPILSIIEKGDWNYKNKEELLTFYNRSFISTNDTYFKERYGFTDEVKFTIKDISKDMLSLCQNDDNCSIDEYKKVKRTEPLLTKSFDGTGTTVESLSITRPGVVLEVEYEFYNEADQFIIEDQDGNVIYKSEMIPTKIKKKKSVLLADFSKILHLNELKLKINSSKADSKWKISLNMW